MKKKLPDNYKLIRFPSKHFICIIIAPYEQLASKDFDYKHFLNKYKSMSARWSWKEFLYPALAKQEFMASFDGSTTDSLKRTDYDSSILNISLLLSSSLPMLTRQGFKRIATDDTKVEMNIFDLVHAAVLRIYPTLRYYKPDEETLETLKADPFAYLEDHPATFSTYAHDAVLQEMNREIRRIKGLGTITETEWKQHKWIQRFIEECKAETGHAPSNEQIALEYNMEHPRKDGYNAMHPDNVRWLRNLDPNWVQLNEQKDYSAFDLNRSGRYSDNPVKQLEYSMIHDCINKALDDPYKTAILMKAGLGEYTQSFTDKEIGLALGFPADKADSMAREKIRTARRRLLKDEDFLNLLQSYGIEQASS